MPIDEPWKIARSLKVRRDVLPHLVLQRLADQCLVAANSSVGNDQMYWCIGAITFAAFKVEAFINFAGWSRIERWAEIESVSSPVAKLAMLEASQRFKVDRACYPFNLFAALIKFRNRIVHGKVEAMELQFTEDHNHPIPVRKAKTPFATWERDATLKNAKRLVQASTEIIASISEHCGLSVTSDGHAADRIWVEPV